MPTGRATGLIAGDTSQGSRQMNETMSWGQLFLDIAVVVYLLGLGSAVHALMTTRTSQGAIAWVLSLIWFPWLSVPAYWVFGRSKFEGYVIRRQAKDLQHRDVITRVVPELKPFLYQLGEHETAAMAAENMARMPIVTGNAVDLLIDGEATFASIFRGIEQARRFIMVQFYIVNDDQIGRDLQARLIAKARNGIKVYFLYDELGSLGLNQAYIDELRAAGVDIRPFNTTRGRYNRFQLNFRNHRKIVVVDARITWIGGHNVGDEYLGRDPKIGRWRDTHVRIEGPAALAAQVSFQEDWFWATGHKLDLTYSPVHCRREANIPVLIIPTGPADTLETASLMFVHAINRATRRVWISSPYFIPDEPVLAALHLARLRGVDVRIVIPEMPDNKLMYFAAYYFFDALSASNVRFYRYRDGFIHEKVILIDDELAAIGTANFDNRSFRLNFEVTAMVRDREFANQVEAMFHHNFEHSRLMEPRSYADKPYPFKLVVRAVSLLAPIL
jgi:cardiolipin synthase